MTEHQKAILEMKRFLLRQLEKNMKKEFVMAQKETEVIREIHLLKAAQYSRRIALVQQELLVFKEKNDDRRFFKTKNRKFTGADYRQIEK
jgi:hypothetical protein